MGLLCCTVSHSYKDPQTSGRLHYRSPHRSRSRSHPLSSRAILIMKFTSAVLALAAFVSAASATDVRYDETYDDANGSLSTVACSDGSNGFLTKGFPTFGSIPTFPNIGAAQAIEGWNSASCGSCWELTYGDNSIIITAIDHASDGFNIALEAMNTLTDGQAVALGEVSVTAKQVETSKCGL
ncbi:Cerato-platanin-domain-containing protein [Gloeopeniophorella convolvens]|nr:Cerato-platanin-domain-containing protein [Gloeopeniophorella convolvens]